jgi:arsenate reductase (thioredoxin)
VETFNVLFLCTGNSARSILAEAALNHLSRVDHRFKAFSAGSHPKGEVHPLAVETLKQNRIPVDDLRSKSWNEFERPDAPPLHFVFTVCDNAAAEVCPVWPGQFANPAVTLAPAATDTFAGDGSRRRSSGALSGIFA